MLFIARNIGMEYAVIWGVVCIFSICCHEYMHARVALWQGDDTAKLMGHLTLNPLKQMGVVSLVMLLIVGLAFGKVPIDRSRLRRPYGEAIVSFAGPFANLMLFILFSIGLAIATIYGNEPVVKICGAGGVLNSVLFIFNMLPFPSLDGYGVLTSFFPEFRNRSSSEFVNGATFLVFMLIFMFSQYLFVAGRYLTNHIAVFFYQVLNPILG